MVSEYFDIATEFEFIDWQELRDFMREAGGGNIYPVSADSEDVFPENDNPLCRRIIDNPHGLNRCIAIHRLQLREIRDSLRPSLFRCHAGFWNIAIPLHYDGEFLGAVMGCGVLDHTRKKIDYQTLADELNIEFEDLNVALRKVPLLSKNKIKAMQSLLSMMLQGLIYTQLTTDRKNKLIKRYEKAFLEFNTLYKIYKTFRSTPEFDLLQTKLINIICSEMKSDAAFLYFFNESNKLILSGTTVGYEDLVGTVALDIDVMNKAMAESESSMKAGFPLPTPLPKDGKIITTTGQQNFAAQLFTPLISNNITIGCIELVSGINDAYIFTPKDEDFYKTIISQCSMAFENALLRRKTELLSVTDEMTGLNNFRYFSRKLSEEITRCARYGHTLSLIMIDLDRFKDFNDTFGHPAGDNALSVLAGIMRNNIRDVDTAARYGGEEFVIVLPETGLKEAMLIIERIRIKVEEHDFIPRNHEHYRKLTISAGIATFPEDAQDKKFLIERSDKALYYSKNKGRNRVTHYKDIENLINLEIDSHRVHSNNDI